MARIATREEMGALLERWRHSGESASGFCRRHRMNPQKLSYWKRVLGQAGPLVRRRSGRRGAVGLVPVRLAGGDGVRGALEIHLASGDRVVFPEGGSLNVLREVVAVLRERC